MKVATVSDLRNHFPRIARRIEDGEQVQIRKQGKVFAILSPAREKKKKVEWPDLMARLKKIYPHPIRGKSLGDIVSESRGDR